MKVACFDVHDFEFHSNRQYENPFVVQITGKFTHESGDVLQIPGFYDGDGIWKVRFCPTKEGHWCGEVASDDPNLDGFSSLVLACVPNENERVHGRVMTDAHAPHRFRFEDGTVCVPLGFEWDWMSAYHQVHGVEAPSDRDNPSFEDAVDLVCEGGSNYLMANLYAHFYHRTEISDQTRPYLYQFPEHFIFEGTNDDPDHARLNIAFFQTFDRAVAALHQRGVMLHLMIQVQNKKVNWPERATEEDDRFWRYLVARYQAYGNVIWDISKESYNLLNRTGSHDYTLSRIALIKASDGYDHLITAHDSERESWGKETAVDAVCDFISDQVKFGGTVDGWEMASAYKLNREAVRRWRQCTEALSEYGIWV